MNIKANLTLNVSFCAGGRTAVAPFLIHMLLFSGFATDPRPALLAVPKALLVGCAGAIIKQQQFTVMGVGDAGR